MVENLIHVEQPTPPAAVCEDLWVLPQEDYTSTVAPMQPYYILMKPSGSHQFEYLLMTPFTPQKRNDMISWLAARRDFPEYGEMLFYELPKDKLIYGPMQIEAMIDQNTTIAQQLTLWDQKGSKVIRGNLIAAPIENSFLYVVPLHLTAEGTDLPQVKRVIVISGIKWRWSLHSMKPSKPSLGRSNPRIPRRPRSGCNRNWAMHRKPRSRGIGETSARRWMRSNSHWPGRHNRYRQ